MLCLSLLSCSRDDDNIQPTVTIDKTVEGKWTVNKITVNGVNQTLSNCQKSDYFKMYSGAFEKKYYSTSCSIDLVSGTYKVDTKENVITITHNGISENLVIKDATTNKLVYSTVVNPSPNVYNTVEYELVK